MTTPKYNYGHIRSLLTQGFNEDELRILCYDEPDFRQVYDNWPRGTPKSTFVQELIDLAERRLKLGALLDLAQKHNPAMYLEHGPYYEDDQPAAPATPAVSTAQAVDIPVTPPQGTDIFISYARPDLDFVGKLYQYLTDQGLSVWFDQANIDIGAQSSETLVKGIMGCQIMVVVLSPEAARSKNLRKELDLAVANDKKILPLVWRGDRESVTPSEIAYQLAGLNYFDFKGQASPENLGRVANTIIRILGGASIAEAAPNEAVIHTRAIAVAQPAPEPAPEQDTGRRRRDRRERTPKVQVSAVATLGAIMARVVTPLSVNVEADEVDDAINSELEWLFAAADHVLRVRQGQADRSEPVSVEAPPEAEGSAEALTGNKILAKVNDFRLEMSETQVVSIINQINIYLNNLTMELNKQALAGGADAASIAVRNTIQAQRKEIIGLMKELARLMNNIYGIMVYGPDDLADELAK